MEILPEVRSAYGRGRLVPFLGAGMSRRVCRDWLGMIEALEASAGIVAAAEDGPRAHSNGLDYVRRAAQALDRLRLGSSEAVVESIRKALLENGPAEPPPQTRALASLYWPLVISTNYDDLYPAAVHQVALAERWALKSPDAERRAPIVNIAGRSSIDCHRVLSALSHPAPRLLWALQGYLGGQALFRTPEDSILSYGEWVRRNAIGMTDENGTRGDMRRQIVVGHADYRRVALRSEGFRRAFAEVFRSRSFLFLGSGLSETYFLDLFSQIIEYYGPGTYPHFAVCSKDKVDIDFLRHNFGIWVLEMSHEDLPEFITSIKPQPRQARLLRIGHAVGPSPGERLGITTSELPPAFPATTCVILSGGGSRPVPRLSDRSHAFLHRIGLSGELLEKVPEKQFLWRLPPTSGPLVLVARARIDPDSPVGRELRPIAPSAPRELRKLVKPGRLWRDVRLTPFVLREALNFALEDNRSQAVSTLLASGALRTFPTSYSLVEMIRAWATFPGRDRIALTIHVGDEVAAHDLAAGRIDVPRLLSTDHGHGTIEFWLEIAECDGNITRLLTLQDPSLPLRQLLELHGITGSRWKVDVEPWPCLGWAPWTLEDVDVWEHVVGVQLSLERIGVLHGSTLRLVECPTLPVPG